MITAAGALHRLADKRSHALRTKLADALFERIGRARRERLLALGKAVTELVRLHDMLNARDRQVALCVHVLHAAETGGGDR